MNFRNTKVHAHALSSTSFPALFTPSYFSPFTRFFPSLSDLSWCLSEFFRIASPTSTTSAFMRSMTFFIAWSAEMSWMPFDGVKGFFPPNILTDEGDTTAEGTPTPSTPSPSPRTNISQAPPTESEENATTPTINSLIFSRDKEIGIPLDTLHHSPAQTPVPMDNETMLDPPVPTTTPMATCTKPSTSSQESEEDLLRAHLAVAETNRS
ncbi:hypothetical protein EDB19DRAFT_2035238 [Suillus lakei]|nr:hypothetical protein EDB19DRAFT_2035238 [Suillus lakei]